MVRALTLFAWFNSAEDEKRREAARTRWRIGPSIKRILAASCDD
jgi:hypothetical protein